MFDYLWKFLQQTDPIALRSQTIIPCHTCKEVAIATTQKVHVKVLADGGRENGRKGESYRQVEAG